MILAETSSVYFPTQDGSHHLTGIYYLANTDQPAPFALLLHGIPGAEKNHDLAHALRADGWHVLVINYSGSWGSEGTYDMAAQVADARAAVDYALSDTAERPIDATKIAVIGYSLGSRAAILSAYEEDRIGAVVSISGISDFSETMLEMAFYETCEPFLHGVTPADLDRQFKVLGSGIQPIEAAPQLAPRPVLVVHGTEDEVVPYYHAGAFSGANIQLATIEGANHTFGIHRAEMIAAVRPFLNQWRDS